MSARSLYLHVPFCKRKCSYCDFTSFAALRCDPLLEAYANSIASLVAKAHESGLIGELETAYIGGGTPTHLGENLLAIAEPVSALGPREFTVEANPESASLELLSNLKLCCVSRISMGVQSLDDHELAALGRIHDADTALRALANAVSLGYDVSADLMCAIPLQTPSSWAKTLDGIIESGVCHVSVYPLMVEEGTEFSRLVYAGEMGMPDDGDEAARMEEAAFVLSERGFERYEVASYAKPGCACKHNRAYWTGASYLGLGTGAASMFDEEELATLNSTFPQVKDACEGAFRVRLTCTSSADEIAANPALEALRFDVECLDEREALAEDLMLGARMMRPLSQELVSRARTMMGAELDDCLASLIDDGYLAQDLSPTKKGWLFGNELYGRLWGLARAAS